MWKFLLLSLSIITFFSVIFLDIYRVTGSSMEPEYKEGDLVIIVKYRGLYHDIQEGDAVVFISPETGRPILKECRYIDGDEAFLTGTNLPESTDSRHFGRISIEDIKGWVWIKI